LCYFATTNHIVIIGGIDLENVLLQDSPCIQKPRTAKWN
jgi:hypothetical protein